MDYPDSELELAVSSFNLEQVKKLLLEGHTIFPTSRRGKCIEILKEHNTAVYRAFILFQSKTIEILTKHDSKNKMGLNITNVKKIIYSPGLIKYCRGYSETFMNFATLFNVINPLIHLISENKIWHDSIEMISLMLSQQAIEIFLWLLNYKNITERQLIDFSNEVFHYSNTTGLTNINYPVHFRDRIGSDSIQQTLLHILVKKKKNYSNLIKALIELKSDPNLVNYLDETPLLNSCRNGRHDSVCKILIMHTKHINKCKYNLSFKTPLFWTILHNKHDLSQCLIANGARHNQWSTALTKWKFDMFDNVIDLQPLSINQLMFLLNEDLMEKNMKKLEIVFLSWIESLTESNVIILPIILAILMLQIKNSIKNECR